MMTKKKIERKKMGINRSLSPILYEVITEAEIWKAQPQSKGSG